MLFQQGKLSSLNAVIEFTPPVERLLCHADLVRSLRDCHALTPQNFNMPKRRYDTFQQSLIFHFKGQSILVG